MGLVIPAAFFSALDDGFSLEGTEAQAVVTDALRCNFLKMAAPRSSFFSSLSPVIDSYIGSRIYRHNLPGEDEGTTTQQDLHSELIPKEEEGVVQVFQLAG
ncbi:hypothetical protein OF83DRAFT_1281403 [Amylostereum chailletii]|nr:hypothetical protein OF83DRAFT_1281403 [Amylostereum chailletii]